ncbi:hypothetical protein IW262DRAFT_1465528 [Armillaria fumosa]|nr:hypothetical protein IW262DRAFT_1465528 [Armillaria fumosa]
MGFAFQHPFFLEGDEIFSVYSGEKGVFPPVPSGSSPDPNLAEWDAFKLMRWASNETPYMMLVPCHKPFYDALFTRLALEEHTIELFSFYDENDIRRWRLADDTMTYWVSLERNLRMLLSAMLNLSTAPLPKYFRLWSFPKRFGYEVSFKTRRGARRAIMRSRDAFVPLLAALSFMIVLMEWQEDTVEGFHWRDRVLETANIHAEWLADVEQSPIMDRNLLRVGAFVDVQTSEFLWLLPHIYQSFGYTPICLCWGRITSAPISSPLGLEKRDIPDQEIINSLRSKAPHLLHIQKASSESAEDRAAREQRIKHAELQQVPGKGSKSARVFWWEEVDGFFVRRAAGCGKYGLYWALYGRRQRRYDSFRNEWDLCEALAPSDCPNEDDDYDGYGSDDDDFYHEQSNILVVDDDRDQVDHDEEQYSSKMDLQRMYADAVEDCSQEVSPRSYGAVDDIAYSRFGYSPIGEVPDLPGTILWDRVCKFVGLGWDTGMMSQASKAPIGKQLDADNTMCREYYMFHFDETKEVLLLSSSASTIQVLRHQWGCQPGQSIYDIIRELLDRGIAFNFAIPGPYRSLKAEPDPIHARIAGYRPKNYKPTISILSHMSGIVMPFFGLLEGEQHV